MSSQTSCTDAPRAKSEKACSFLAFRRTGCVLLRLSSAVTVCLRFGQRYEASVAKEADSQAGA
ncbi:hypothetical protein ACFL59_09975, partial [Planctomycetota bacterium]